MKEMTVVKLGGSLLEDPARRGAALDAIAARARAAAAGAGSLVLVHGGGKHVDRWLERLGIPRRTHQGLRITDAATLDVVVSVLAGLVNKTLVAELAARGVPSIGLCGADGNLLEAEPIPPEGEIDLGHVGRVTRCHPPVIESALRAGHLPVVASVALGARGSLLNVNADAAAAAVAVALKARRLVYLTDVEGVLDSRGRRVERASAARVRSLLATPAVTGGMRPKLAACLEALESGVGQVLIAGPRQQGAALRRGEGGTRLVAA